MDLTSFLDHYKLFKDIPHFKAAAIMILYVAIALVVSLFMDKILKRLAVRTKLSMDDKLIKFTHGPIFWTVVLLGVLHGISFFGLQAPFDIVAPRAVQTLILLVWFIASFKIIGLIGEHIFEILEKRGAIGRDIYLLTLNLIRVAITVIVVFWTLAIWKVNLTPLFASAGIAGIAVALAAKDTLSNFFGGVSVFMDRSYKVGDYIILDSGERGEVVDIGIRSTRIKTRDDVLITIPNSVMAVAKITNESAPVPSFRIRIPLGVAYGSDLDYVEKVLLDLIKANSLVASRPDPRVRYRAFADSTINLELLCWVKDPRDKGIVTHHIFKDIDRVFKEKGISIPFPQADIYLHGTSDVMEKPL